MDFKPYYAIKCYTTLPIIYIFPQHILDLLVRSQTTHRFYEYYFEPAGKEGTVFLQFMHDDLEKGLAAKRKIEALFNAAQIIMALLIIMAIIVLFFKWKYKYVFSLAIVGLFLTRYLNPIVANYNLYKAQKQSIFGTGPPADPNEEVETFDPITGM